MEGAPWRQKTAWNETKRRTKKNPILVASTHIIRSSFAVIPGNEAHKKTREKAYRNVQNRILPFPRIFSPDGKIKLPQEIVYIYTFMHGAQTLKCVIWQNMLINSHFGGICVGVTIIFAIGFSLVSTIRRDGQTNDISKHNRHTTHLLKPQPKM